MVEEERKRNRRGRVFEEKDRARRGSVGGWDGEGKGTKEDGSEMGWVARMNQETASDGGNVAEAHAYACLTESGSAEHAENHEDIHTIRDLADEEGRLVVDGEGRIGGGPTG